MPLVQHLASLPGQVMADRQSERAGQEAAFDRAQQRTLRGQQIEKGEREHETASQAAEDEQAMVAIFAAPGILDDTGTVDIRKAISLAQQQHPRLVQRLTKAAQEADDGVQKAALIAAQTRAADRTNQPQSYTLTPGEKRFAPGGALEAEVPAEAKPLTFGPLEKVTVNGRSVLARPRSDGVLVDLKGNVLDNAQPEPQMSQQERSGYFTMTPIYDAQGRPIGAMKLNARTGETTLVKPDEMGGGVTARPPGNLGQRTVENEAALDSLGRLKDMYDKGAKDDIGPAEGRARSVGQKVPGGAFVTERFANFEAATRAFQNAMIKAITGAQMSEPEAKRIMGQIPNVNDNPTVWQAKYTQSVKNMEDLENRTRTDRGAPKPDPTDALLDELLRGGQ